MPGAGRLMVRPPFDELDPWLEAAARLLQPPHALCLVMDALPDEQAAFEHLDRVLATTGCGLRLELGGGRCRLRITGSDPVLAAAAVALAVLVVIDGWRRVKKCDEGCCARAILDRTNGCSRRWCDEHSRSVRRSATGQYGAGVMNEAVH